MVSVGRCEGKRMRLIAEVRFELDLDEGEVQMYKEEGLSTLFDNRGLQASEFDEITFEELRDAEV